MGTEEAAQQLRQPDLAPAAVFGSFVVLSRRKAGYVGVMALDKLERLALDPSLCAISYRRNTGWLTASALAQSGTHSLTSFAVMRKRSFWQVARAFV